MHFIRKPVRLFFKDAITNLLLENVVLTRLKVNGFKNLVDVEVWFGPFTCIAGPNAVGKSNLFDAIRFLGNLANNTLMDATLTVRSEGSKTASLN